MKPMPDHLEALQFKPLPDNLWVFIPAYHEQNRIERVLARLLESVRYVVANGTGQSFT
jgi:cellulose synthase/poly-beta-1,6-N-acetylglucosamine synthase-like glycosyltransferase